MRLILIAILLSACSMKATPRKVTIPNREKKIYVLSFVCGFVVTSHFIVKQ